MSDTQLLDRIADIRRIAHRGELSTDDCFRLSELCIEIFNLGRDSARQRRPEAITRHLTSHTDNHGAHGYPSGDDFDSRVERARASE